MSYLQQIGSEIRRGMVHAAFGNILRRSASNRIQEMKRVFLRLGIALVTFTLGVSVTAIYWLFTVPDVALPAVRKVNHNYSCFPGLAVQVAKSRERKEFFTPVSLSSDAGSAEFLNDWYSRHLHAMSESPLAALVDEEESYRFLWLRSFHRPVVVRMWRSGARYFIVAKRLTGRGGYDPGTLDLYWARSLSENDWDAFLLNLEHATYWDMQTEDLSMMTDGAQWIMEGYREGHYHVVDRQSPQESAYRDACLFLLRQSGLLAETPASEVY